MGQGRREGVHDESIATGVNRDKEQEEGRKDKGKQDKREGVREESIACTDRDRERGRRTKRHWTEGKRMYGKGLRNGRKR